VGVDVRRRLAASWLSCRASLCTKSSLQHLPAQLNYFQKKKASLAFCDRSEGGEKRGASSQAKNAAQSFDFCHHSHIAILTFDPVQPTCTTLEAVADVKAEACAAERNI